MSYWSKGFLINADFSLPISISSQKIRGVYRFSLQGNSIPYPKKDGATLYIGKTKDLNGRIHKHITNSDRKSLKSYMNSGKRIYVRYKKIDAGKQLKKLESDELKKHTEDFGMIPICNNQTA
tara:strand:+ start:378 stop:743 length:366 start_codon:yes stop_codon:yes gene_type:complete